VLRANASNSTPNTAESASRGAEVDCSANPRLTHREKTLEYLASHRDRIAEVAQLVEHLTENQGVPSSSLGLGTPLFA
jgi:hypothetical protein